MPEEKFNVINCFDDNIGNLDLCKNYIYVLKLVEDRYYIGKTSNILRRITDHFTNNGAIYTKTFKPIKVIEVEEELTNDDERNKTLLYMEKYGWENVRGSFWCSLKMRNPPKNNKKIKPIFEKKTEPMSQIGDDEIIKMYLENNDIIEIGEKLDKSPGSIAYRLEQNSIIEKRQYAKGYYEYTMSDLYGKICKKKNAKREDKHVKSVKENIHLIVNDINQLKADVNLIKNQIREHFSI